MSSACSAEKAYAGLVSIAPAMNRAMLSRASWSAVCSASHASNETRSSASASGCSQGRSGSICATRPSSSSIRRTISFSVSGLTGKMSPVKRVSTPSGPMYTLSPSRYRWYVSSPRSAMTSMSASWSGETHWPPTSSIAPSMTSVHSRPPTRSRASSTATDRPAFFSSFAAVRPAAPAPTITTSRVISDVLMMYVLVGSVSSPRGRMPRHRGPRAAARRGWSAAAGTGSHCRTCRT